MHSLILGFDAFDPKIFEQLSGAGQLPNLSALIEKGTYSRFEVCAPPQTEVSWTSIATGVDPGGHGIFDFVHRDPSSYLPYVSILRTSSGIMGTQFIPPHKSRTIFEETALQGYPATSLWWPSTFPSRPELPYDQVPGLGTPDIRGQLGVGTLFTLDANDKDSKKKTTVEMLAASGSNRYRGALTGPSVKTKDGAKPAELMFELEILDSQNARLKLDRLTLDLQPGKWSPIIEISFKAGLFFTIHAITRVILTEAVNGVRLYFLPLQIHPLHSTWSYATPPAFAKKLWKQGPFLTLGWPQDTTGLDEGCIDDRQFLELCDSIFDAREKILMSLLGDFREGVIASIFDCLDRIQHMFRRDNPDVVQTWYRKLDALTGRVQARLAQTGNAKANLFVLSDHGFARFDHKVHLNRWLIEKNYMALKPDASGENDLRDVDWAHTSAYAVGLNSLYLNLHGRERDGSVAIDQAGAVSEKLIADLSAWHGPDGNPVFHRVLPGSKVFSGPFIGLAPDLFMGYESGYRASADTGLGKWGASSLEANRDHWGADHCIDPEVVPGVFMINKKVDVTAPSFRDIPRLVVGKDLDQSSVQPPTTPAGGEDQKLLEERLKGLGYL
jgi:predicted AlkP superfamily phosphohydrolase/phosphomutase